MKKDKPNVDCDAQYPDLINWVQDSGGDEIGNQDSGAYMAGLWTAKQTSKARNTSSCGSRSCSRRRSSPRQRMYAACSVPVRCGGTRGFRPVPRTARLLPAVERGTVHQQAARVRKARPKRGKDFQAFDIDISPIHDRKVAKPRQIAEQRDGVAQGDPILDRVSRVEALTGSLCSPR